MNRTCIIIGLTAAVLFQTAILVQMVWSQITLLNSPIEVVLQTTPVDPRDIFRGDYVVLNYKISTFTNEISSIEKTLNTGEKVFVVLNTKGPYATAVRVLAANPATIAADEAVISGTLNWTNENVGPTTGSDCGDCTTLSISYPIDSYFVPEGTGMELEERRNANALGVIVALNEDGDAAVKGLMMDGIKIYDTPLF